MDVVVQKLVESRVLGGAIMGEALLPRLIQAAGTPPDNEPILLDFRGVDVATASFLRASVFAFRAYCAEARPDNPILIANANPVVLEELRQLLADRGDALVACDHTRGRVTNARVIGLVDGQQREALEFVLRAGTADAVALGRALDPRSSSRPTKWNNALAALAKRGLLLEGAAGRRKVYSPVVEGMRHGN